MKRYFTINIIICCTIILLSGCANNNSTLKDSSAGANAIESDKSGKGTVLDIDYVELMQDKEKYDGQLVRVAGQVDYIDLMSVICIDQRLGAYSSDFSTSSGFRVQLDENQKVTDLCEIGTYIVATGVWDASYKGIRDANIEATGDEAKKIADKYNDVWLANRSSVVEKLTLSDFRDLEENVDTYNEQYVFVAGKIITEDLHFPQKVIYIGYEGSKETLDVKLFGLSKEMQEKCVSGEYVVLSGKYMQKGNLSVQLEDCYVEAIGEDAKSKSDAIADKRNGKAKIAMQEFIDSCKIYDYQEITRYPDKYKGVAMKVEGTVFQSDADNNVMLISTIQGDNLIYVNYTDKADGTARILENDNVTFYGKFGGIKTYTTVLGDENSIPCLNAVASEIN